uniref:NACHT domain-containing protein n=1 Tax=Astyanax mexicanus TaxID=7994 RepID=A0A3B1ICL1_ASTMX
MGDPAEALEELGSQSGVISHRSSVTAQNAGMAVAPQMTGCNIGSLNMSFATSANPKQAHLQALNASPDIGKYQLYTIDCKNVHILKYDCISLAIIYVICSSINISESIKKGLKSKFKRKYEMIFEGIAKRGKPALLRNIYAELIIMDGESEGLNAEHEFQQIKDLKNNLKEDLPISCNDLFTPRNFQSLEGDMEEIKTTQTTEKTDPRTVVTLGIAGIGKTVSVQKFILDWAEGKANQDIDLLLVLPFRDLNSIKDEKQSLHELLLCFHPELKELENSKYFSCKILFIFDGLDESQLPLRFGCNGRVSDVSKPASLDELMTNLIDGNLLPSALIWITTRPAAIDKIPSHLIHRMTEVEGFTDSQKEVYFRNRFTNQNLASKIISHVKESRSLEIMCHIPVFCWITATVLEQMLKGGHEEIPSSLTELYTRFLLIQTSEKKKKYLGIRENDPLNLYEEDVHLILKLGKLAFNGLHMGNIVFSEDDLKQYNIDIPEASLRSGVFTEFVRGEDPMFSEKIYSFVHLSFQEYLAAIYVLHTFANKRENAIECWVNKCTTAQHLILSFIRRISHQQMSLYDLHKYAIDEALKSNSGHLNLFLRFLLGLSMESNQKLLKSFSLNVESGQVSIQQTVQYLKSKFREIKDGRISSSERCMNLLQCLLELNDHSMVEVIKRNSDISVEEELLILNPDIESTQKLAIILNQLGAKLDEEIQRSMNQKMSKISRLVLKANMILRFITMQVPIYFPVLLIALYDLVCMIWRRR